MQLIDQVFKVVVRGGFAQKRVGTQRIAPVYVEISRKYYGKAKGYKTQMQEAARLARSGNWGLKYCGSPSSP